MSLVEVGKRYREDILPQICTAGLTNVHSHLDVMLNDIFLVAASHVVLVQVQKLLFLVEVHVVQL